MKKLPFVNKVKYDKYAKRRYVFLLNLSSILDGFLGLITLCNLNFGFSFWWVCRYSIWQIDAELKDRDEKTS